MSTNVTETQKDLRTQVLKSILWLGSMKYLGQLVSWAITIFVMRILQPGDYGLMALSSVCVNFLAMIGELGLGAAIIQKKDTHSSQLSQLFGFILLSHGCVFLMVFFSSGLIAVFFAEPRLEIILRVLSTNFLFLSLYIIPQAILMRKMDFQKTSFVALAATVVSSVSTLVLALNGFGVWALIWSSVLNNFVCAVGFTFLQGAIIIPKFKITGIGSLLSFGGYTMGFRFLHFFYTSSDILIGSRIMGPQAIGPYSVAVELSSIPLEKCLPILNQVAFPAYARIQSDLDQVRSHFFKATRMVGLFVFPAFWGLMVIAPELIEWVLGQKWAAAVVPFQVLCLIMPFRALGSLFSPMLNGLGKPRINFIYILLAAILLPLSFLLGARHGFLGLSLAWLFGYLIVFVISLVLSIRAIAARIYEYIANIVVILLSSSSMVGLLFLIKSLPLMTRSLSPPSLTCLLVLIGAASYLGMLLFLKPNVVYEVFSLLPVNYNPFRKLTPASQGKTESAPRQ